MPNLKIIFYIIVLTFFPAHLILSQEYKIIESNESHIILEFNFNSGFFIRDTVIDGNKFTFVSDSKFPLQEPEKPFLPTRFYELGVPFESKPTVTILNIDREYLRDKFVIPTPDSADQPFNELNFDESIYGSNSPYPIEVAWMNSTAVYRYINTATLIVAPFQFNPTERLLIRNRQITVKIDFNSGRTSLPFITSVVDAQTDDFIGKNLLNPKESKTFTGKIQSQLKKDSQQFWFNPNKTYYKIFLKNEAIYRLTYNYFLSNGISLQNVKLNKVELFNDGIEIPLFIRDTNGNNNFDPGDYIEFVGLPPKPSPYSYLNIYNTTNVYWLSFEADSSGKRYNLLNGYPTTWTNSYSATPHIIHYEEDVIYERLGHALDDKRDYWFWGKSSGLNGTMLTPFVTQFPSPKNLSTSATSLQLRVSLQGMTTEACLTPDHRVKFFLTSQPVGEFTFDGPTAATYETTVNFSQTGIFQSNNLQVYVFGDIPVNPCSPSSSRYDEVRVNWFEIEYLRDLRAESNSFYFSSPAGVTGKTRFSVFNWQPANMRILIPGTSSVITNPLVANDIYKQVLFVDDISTQQKYYCVAEEYSQLPDSIKADINDDLHNVNKGADYIIIYHPDFYQAAERLKQFRLSDFPDPLVTNPRVEIVNVFEIYDEFSSGLVDPFAIKQFIKYAFENWQSPAPAYVVLLGDMSYNYRNLPLSISRPNFIPSIPHHARVYGQSASDNNFVTVAGTDYKPDLAIGRLSCETLAEANILIDKLMNYPADSDKKWKQNLLLISSGADQFDEQLLGFNEANLVLDRNYLVPNGITSRKIFRYPNELYPEQAQFKGEGPDIREGFNEGAVFANYYGHGGGYQWDLVFNNDDIYQLSNGGKLPFISSVTCYTAHFDNQDVFGEQFNKVPNKGSIGFFGSSGLTYWTVGKYFNEILFGQVFNSRNNIVGKAIQSAKGLLPEGGFYTDQVSLLTLLGDPLLKLAIPDKPDFSIKQDDISLSPSNPVINDSVRISATINNLGIVFPNDTLLVQVFVSSDDTSYYLPDKKLTSFGEKATVVFNWIPDKGGLYNLTFNLNSNGRIDEIDLSDNATTISVPVYDLGTPNIIKPLNGDVVTGPSVHFLFADNGYYALKELKYLIQIDTSLSFTNPIIKSSDIIPERALLSWQSPGLNPGKYFWRTRILTESDSSSWSDIFAITIDPNSSVNGKVISDNHLNLFHTSNILYSSAEKSLILNTEFLPPRPTNNKFIESLSFTKPADIHSYTALTTDGTFIYIAHMAYYGGPSKIYKVGTGFNGTQKGLVYGSVPNLSVPVWHSIFYYDNFIYVATGKAYRLLKVDPTTGDTASVHIPSGLLNSVDTRVHDGAFYLNSDGRYVYNVAYITSDGENKYTVRILDPLNNWNLVRDLVPTDRSFPNFCGFFVADGYFYPYENYQEGFLRRINLETGFYEEEWFSYNPYQAFYAWSYDYVNDLVYASVYGSGFQPKIFKFVGRYKDAKGNIITTPFGPATKINLIDFLVDESNSQGKFTAHLQGFNKNTRNWETIVSPLLTQSSPQFNNNIYRFFRLTFDFVDSSFGTSEPLKLKNVLVDYEAPPEIIITKDDITFDPDTLLQGFNVVIGSSIKNIGYSDADSIKLDYFIKSVDFSSTENLFSSRIINLKKDSSLSFADTIKTDRILFNNNVKVSAAYSKSDMFGFNNSATNTFYVARDSSKPSFSITFDGREIIDRDIISSEPTIVITLEDNSPLPITPAQISITHLFKNEQEVVAIPSEVTTFTYEPFPNSKATVTWKPVFEEGLHTLIVSARDSSNNYFDSTSYNINFEVYSSDDLRAVYNYPNPFSDNTFFTFEIRGVSPPEEFKIKIFTIAGRLIKEFDIPQSELRIGFNKIYWDGRDQDGDEIANGLYFYKIISKQNNEVRTITQKLAKVK